MNWSRVTPFFAAITADPARSSATAVSTRPRSRLMISCPALSNLISSRVRPLSATKTLPAEVTNRPDNSTSQGSQARTGGETVMAGCTDR